MVTSYTLEAPAYGMTAYNESSFQVKGDATASSFLANTAGKLHFSGALDATLAGVTLNLNAASVISIEAVNTIKAAWHNGQFKLSTVAADEDTAAIAAAMQKTESKLRDFSERSFWMKETATRLSARVTKLASCAVLMEN